MHAKKTLGQHFLRCAWAVSAIVRAAEIEKSDTVLEVGPGTGALTKKLAKYAQKVIAVEKDQNLAEELKKQLTQEGINNVEIITADILKPLPKHPYNKVVGNIPYYLTSRLIRMLLESENRPKLIVFTVQKEVAQRIVATPSKMNLLGLSVQVFGKPKIIRIIPSGCFLPEPQIDSAIIKISDISDRFFHEYRIGKKEFFEITRRAFLHKRKLLLNTLSGFTEDKTALEKILEKIGLNKKARPEELSKEEWAKLAKKLVKF